MDLEVVETPQTTEEAISMIANIEKGVLEIARQRDEYRDRLIACRNKLIKSERDLAEAEMRIEELTDNA